ncbi:MAG: SIS domain-containing protein [Bdellovibrionales bacterium]|nr:SIS domain-containing protein [Bdellovibrionales bacterium]
METNQVWRSSFEEAQNVLAAFAKDPEQLQKCSKFTDMIHQTFQNGGNVFSAGNGGSHCDAMHFAEEFTGRYRKNRRPLGVLALGDPSHTTCVANDYGFEHIFERQLRGLGRKGDLFVCMSTSGNSKNVILAVNAAKELGIKSVGLLGKDGGELKSLVDLAIVIPAQTADRIQEMHIKILHTAIETVERRIFPENY